MDEIKLIDNTLLESISTKAKLAERKRTNYNFHESFTDPINRMLNALEPGTYCRPHKHENPDKREVFLVLKGSMAVLFFDDEGKVIQTFKLTPTEGSYGVEVPPKVWHTLVCLTSGSVAYEIKDGPYEPMTDKDFAPWAPAEGSDEAEAYLSKILSFIS